MPRRLIILGSTGSIGTQALDVVRHINALADQGDRDARLTVVGLAAGENAPLLAQQAAQFGVREVALCGNGHELPRGLSIRTGPGSAERLVREVECDMVLAGIVGIAGLPATYAAVQLGRDVALANKETLVAAGSLIVPEAHRTGSALLPVDSEHAGVWQCLTGCGTDATVRNGDAPPLKCGESVRRIILTASGGPFRTWTKDRIDAATPEQALKHPTWSMGAKVTIDSASLMNKALELIEAHWLFGVGADRLAALVHPQSIVHALVERADGSCVAQMAAADMRTPIQSAFTWPCCLPGTAHSLDWRDLSKLEFEEPDLDRFPALGLGFEVIQRGGTTGAILNAANEEAVGAFIRAAGSMPFGAISRTAAAVLERVRSIETASLEDVLDADAAARAMARTLLSR